MKIILRVGGIGPDYARLNGDAFAHLVACAFTSKRSERDDPKTYVSLRYTAFNAQFWDESFVEHLVKVIDHEIVHLFTPLVELGDMEGTAREESLAIGFEDIGAWARASNSSDVTK